MTNAVATIAIMPSGCLQHVSALQLLPRIALQWCSVLTLRLRPRHCIQAMHLHTKFHLSSSQLADI